MISSCMKILHIVSLSDRWNLRANNKSDLVVCLDDFTTPVSDPPAVDTIILDCAAVVHLLDPRTAQAFSDYTDTVTMPYIDRQLQLRETQRIDLVSRDTYIHDSLASSTRKGRGKRIRRRAIRTFQTTGRGFSVFLTNEVMKKSHAILVYVTDKDSVLCPHQEAVTDYIIIISPCNHEKAYTCVIILVFDSARKGSQKLLVRTIDTDILVLEIAYAERLGVQNYGQPLVQRRNFAIWQLTRSAKALGSTKSRALPMFRSFTRCDMVSELAGNGKKCMVCLGSVGLYLLCYNMTEQPS